MFETKRSYNVGGEPVINQQQTNSTPTNLAVYIPSLRDSFPPMTTVPLRLNFNS